MSCVIVCNIRHDKNLSHPPMASCTHGSQVDWKRRNLWNVHRASNPAHIAAHHSRPPYTTSNDRFLLLMWPWLIRLGCPQNTCLIQSDVYKHLCASVSNCIRPNTEIWKEKICWSNGFSHFVLQLEDGTSKSFLKKGHVKGFLLPENIYMCINKWNRVAAARLWLGRYF